MANSYPVWVFGDGATVVDAVRSTFPDDPAYTTVVDSDPDWVKIQTPGRQAVVWTDSAAGVDVVGGPACQVFVWTADTMRGAIDLAKRLRADGLRVEPDPDRPDLVAAMNAAATPAAS